MNAIINYGFKSIALTEMYIDLGEMGNDKVNQNFFLFSYNLSWEHIFICLLEVHVAKYNCKISLDLHCNVHANRAPQVRYGVNDQNKSQIKTSTQTYILRCWDEKTWQWYSSIPFKG